MTKCESFYPIINNNSKVLILGSMPGIKSLNEQQYYAHQQNRFWKLMGIFCNCKNLQNLNYQKKLQILLNNNFALWDIIEFCDREGSLDSNIQNEVPNDIPQLLNKYPNTKIICLNGNKAYTAFKKHFPMILRTYKCYKMPSTSPANARYNLEKLYDAWSKLKD